MLKDVDAELKLVIAGNHDLSLHKEYYLEGKTAKDLQEDDYDDKTAAEAEALWTGPETKSAGMCVVLGVTRALRKVLKVTAMAMISWQFSLNNPPGDYGPSIWILKSMNETMCQKKTSVQPFCPVVSCSQSHLFQYLYMEICSNTLIFRRNISHRRSAYLHPQVWSSIYHLCFALATRILQLGIQLPTLRRPLEPTSPHHRQQHHTSTKLSRSTSHSRRCQSGYNDDPWTTPYAFR